MIQNKLFVLIVPAEIKYSYKSYKLFQKFPSSFSFLHILNK